MAHRIRTALTKKVAGPKKRAELIRRLAQGVAASLQGKARRSVLSQGGLEFLGKRGLFQLPRPQFRLSAGLDAFSKFRRPVAGLLTRFDHLTRGLANALAKLLPTMTEATVLAAAGPAGVLGTGLMAMSTIVDPPATPANAGGGGSGPTIPLTARPEYQTTRQNLLTTLAQGQAAPDAKKRGFYVYLNLATGEASLSYARAAGATAGFLAFEFVGGKQGILSLTKDAELLNSMVAALQRREGNIAQAATVQAFLDLHQLTPEERYQAVTSAAQP